MLGANVFEQKEKKDKHKRNREHLHVLHLCAALFLLDLIRTRVYFYVCGSFLEQDPQTISKHSLCEYLSECSDRGKGILNQT